MKSRTNDVVTHAIDDIIAHENYTHVSLKHLGSETGSGGGDGGGVVDINANSIIWV
jgi:hypothetical protein